MYRHPSHRPDANPGKQRNERRGFAQPDRGPAASAVRTRNFSQLISACGGEEALGERLNVPLVRIKELREGYSFSSETAFHIENELDLPSGWLDRANATLPALKPSSAPALDVAVVHTPENSQKEPEVPRKPAAQVDASESARPATKSVQVVSMPGLGGGEPTKPELVMRDVPVSSPAARTRKAGVKPVAPEGTSDQASSGSAASDASQLEGTQTPQQENRMARGPRINEPEEMMERRRQNIMVLTDFGGGKTGLGRLLGLSPANISHVLHGKKKFTRDVAEGFEQALRLPEQWLDTARTAADVPEHVKTLILEAFNSKEGAKPPRAAPRQAVRAPRAAAVPAPAAPQSSQAPAASPAAATVANMLSGASDEQSAAPVVARKVVSAPAVPEQLAVEMGELQAKPFAQALVRIIVLLSRSNQLPEEKCLRLLNEVTLMASAPAAA